MKFVSTRGQAEEVSFSEAVAIGLAQDGGLFLPQKLPNIASHLAKWEALGFADLAFEFLQFFATDIEPAALFIGWRPASDTSSGNLFWRHEAQRLSSFRRRTLRVTLKPQVVCVGSNARDWNGNANSAVQPSVSIRAFANQTPSHWSRTVWLFSISASQRPLFGFVENM